MNNYISLNHAVIAFVNVCILTIDIAAFHLYSNRYQVKS